MKDTIKPCECNAKSSTDKNSIANMQLRQEAAKTQLGDDVLIVGGGGREHAIAYKLMQSQKTGTVYGAPGNDGMSVVPTGLSATDIDGITEFCRANPQIKLVVVAPDDPLAMGLTDKLERENIRAFGPKKAAAKLEWSKAYAKDFMKRYKIPTAEYAMFSDSDSAFGYLATAAYPLVVKADGLALGKGVIICETKEQGIAAVRDIMREKKFGSAGNRIIIEQFLRGYEVSLLVFTDGVSYKTMPPSCDHKRALDGNKGLNTGGMGAYCPCPAFTDELLQRALKTIVEPTLAGCRAEGEPFKGVLYFGLMVDGDDIKVLEYNARFGDPEAQSILPLLKSDLYDIFNAIIDGKLDSAPVEFSSEKSINVVMASGGYPLDYSKGYPIKLGAISNDVNVFFAGVKRDGSALVTNGGRVLCVQAAADSFQAARKKVYDNIARIEFKDAFYRKDIGVDL